MGRTVAHRIEVLGAVRAWRDEQEIPLGSPQQRTVLALLAIAGGRGVPMRTLVDALWSADPPRSAVNVVQTYLKRLRRLLEPDRPPRSPSVVLPSIGDGYALDVDPDLVDVSRFRTLVGAARQARTDGNHARVTALLGEALRLWKGNIAGDLPVPVDHPWPRALISERRTAIGWFAEAALGSGAAIEALPLVEEAAAVNPLDEPLQAYLIRLYHSVGQRADAVRSYHQARQRLRDELGFDPGQALADAYLDLLRDEPSGQAAS